MSGNNEQTTITARQPALLIQDALLHCQFGRFHRRLLLASILSTFSSTMVTTTSSYLLPNAGCDLQMNIMEKGLLNAGPFIGFGIASLVSYLFIEVFGRKKFLVGGHLAIFIFTVLEASSQTYWSILFMKVLEGAILIFCLISMLTLFDEFIHKSLRNRIWIFVISFSHLIQIGAALISWGLLPHDNWHFVIWRGYFEIRSWNIYLYACSMFSLLAAVMYYNIPESPIFLYFQGKELEALEILKSVYSENTGNDRNTFPIKTLGSLGVVRDNRMSIKTVKKYFSSVRELFRKPLFGQLMLFSCLTFVSHFIYSALRLWYPQLSTVVETYRKEHGDTDRFCVMMNRYTFSLNVGANNGTVPEECVTAYSGPETYVNVIIMALVTFFTINVSGCLIKHLGCQLLMFLLFVLCAVSAGALYLASSSFQIVLLVAAMCAFLQTNLLLNKIYLTDLFPPTLRVLGLTTIILWSMVGTVLGNVLFPVLLQIDCMVPFLTFANMVLGASALVYFIPSKTQ